MGEALCVSRECRWLIRRLRKLEIVQVDTDCPTGKHRNRLLRQTLHGTTRNLGEDAPANARASKVDSPSPACFDQGRMDGTEVKVPYGMNRRPRPESAPSGFWNLTYPRLPAVAVSFSAKAKAEWPAAAN